MKIIVMAFVTTIIWVVVSAVILALAIEGSGEIVPAMLFGFGSAMVSTAVMWTTYLEQEENQTSATTEKAKNSMSSYTNQAEDRMNLLWDLMTEEERADMKQRLMSSVKDSDGEISVESLLYNQRQ